MSARRYHRPGRPSKLDTDPELRAFVLARIAETPFVQLEAQVRAHFGRERGLSRSSLCRIWHHLVAAGVMPAAPDEGAR